MEIFQAMALVKGGDGSYLATKVWEIDLMIRLGKTDEEYGDLPVETRALMIADQRLPKWVEMLQSNKDWEEAKRKNGRV